MRTCVLLLFCLVVVLACVNAERSEDRRPIVKRGKNSRDNNEEGKKVVRHKGNQDDDDNPRKPVKLRNSANSLSCQGTCLKSANKCKGKVISGNCPGKKICCQRATVIKKSSVKRFCKPLEPCNKVVGECRKKKTGCKKGEKRYKNSKKINYCSKKSCICCASPCSTKRKCTNLNGVCGLKKDGCDGYFLKGNKYCNGKGCGCCAADNPCKNKNLCTKENGECMPKNSPCEGELKTKNSEGKKYCRGARCACCVPSGQPSTIPPPIPPTTVPQTMAPPTTVPQTMAPPTTAPPPMVPPTTLPQTMAPPTTLPQTMAPPTTAPPPTVPPTTLPQTTAPPTTLPQTMAPPTTLPQTTAPPTTVPQTTAPPTTLPQTTAPPTSIPQTTAPPTTIPQTTATPCNYSQFDANHTVLLPPKTSCSIHLTGVTDAEKAVILSAHNNLRARVANGLETRGDPGPQPAGANIRELVWNNELATVAQAWAAQCPSGHDCNACRKICSRTYAVGQNIYYYWGFNASSFWSEAVQAWYDEVADFPNTGVASFSSASPSGRAIGHYTQVVWAETNEVGCGGIHYSTIRNGITFPESKTYVCNYGKAGNFLTQPLYIQGAAASQCPTVASSTYSGLCA